MQQDMIPSPPAALERVLDALAEDLVTAGDDEIARAAEDLGMNLKMKGSAAFIGLGPLPKRIEDIFEVESLREGHARFMRPQAGALPKPPEGDDDKE